MKSLGPPAWSADVLPQPLPRDWSIAEPGPHPYGVKSGPLNPATLAPPVLAAQSRRRAKFFVVLAPRTARVSTAES